MCLDSDWMGTDPDRRDFLLGAGAALTGLGIHDAQRPRRYQLHTLASFDDRPFSRR